MFRWSLAFRTLACRFRRDERGSVLVFFAASLLLFVALSAAVIDLGYLFGIHGKLQATTDAAALAGASQLGDEDAVKAAAVSYAVKNMPTAQNGNVVSAPDAEIGYWHFTDRTFTPGGSPGNAVRVTGRRTAENSNGVGLFFAQVFGFNEGDVATQSVAAKVTVGPPCLLALDSSESSAAKVNNGTVKAEGCAFHVNSAAPDSLDIAQNGTLEADSVCARGGVAGAGTSDPPPQTPCPSLDDPLADLEPPEVTGCDYTNTKFSNGSHTLSPGVYCKGISLSSTAQVEFEPGTYIIDGGSLSTTGNSASMAGEGVTFFFTDGGSLDLSGQGSVDLSAPDSGDLKGILFFGDPEEPAGLNHGVSGGANMVYEGTMYFPTGDLTFTGNGAGSSAASYTVAIARTLTFSGNGSLDFKWDDSGDVPLPDALAGLSEFSSLALVD